MADFNTYNAGGPIGSSVTPQGGVASPGLGMALEGLSNMASTFGNAFQKAQALEAKNIAAENKTAGDKVVGGFVTTQLKLVDAFEQGMSQQEARTRLRANLAKAIADNPALTDDIMQAHKELMSTAGLGKVVDEGTKQQQMYQEAASLAYKAGFGEGEEAVNSYLKFQRSQAQLQEAQAQITYQNSKLEQQGKITSNLSAAQALEERTIIRTQETAVAGMADAYSSVVADKAKTIYQKVQTGELTMQDGMAELNALQLTITSTINSQGRKTGSEYLTIATKPMLDTIDMAKKALSGEESLTALNNQVSSMVTQQKLIMVSDPKNAKVVATSELLRNIQNLQVGVFNDAAIRMLGQATDEGQDVVNPYTKDDQASRSVFKVLQENLKKIQTGKVSEGTLREMDVAITDILTGVDMYSNSVQDLKQINELQNFLADPNFANYINKNGGIPAKAVQGAKDAVQSMYNDKVLPLIEAELNKATVVASASTVGRVVVMDNKPATNYVRAKFSGSEVVFVGEGPGKEKAKELNKKLAPVMNKMIRVKAHLEGSTDYKSAYDVLFSDKIQQEMTNDAGNP